MSLFEYSLFWACLAFFSLVQTSLLMHKRSLQWSTIWWALRWKRVSSKGLCSLISITISVTIGLFVLTVLTGVNPERLEKLGYSLAKSRESCHVSAENENKSKPTDGYETSLKMSLKISNYRLSFIIMDFLFGICLIEPTESVSTQPISRKSRRAVSCFVIMISLKIRSHSVNLAGRSAPQAHWTTKVEKKKEAVLFMSIESLGDIIIIIMKDRGLLFIGHQGRFQNRQCPAVGRAGMTWIKTNQWNYHNKEAQHTQCNRAGLTSPDTNGFNHLYGI